MKRLVALEAHRLKVIRIFVADAFVGDVVGLNCGPSPALHTNAARCFDARSGPCCPFRGIKILNILPPPFVGPLKIDAASGSFRDGIIDAPKPRFGFGIAEAESGEWLASLPMLNLAGQRTATFRALLPKPRPPARIDLSTYFRFRVAAWEGCRDNDPEAIKIKGWLGDFHCQEFGENMSGFPGTLHV